MLAVCLLKYNVQKRHPTVYLAVLRVRDQFEGFRKFKYTEARCMVLRDMTVLVVSASCENGGCGSRWV
jgi:hypothetical protein